METKIWDLRSYRNDINQSPDIQEIKDTVINGGLVALPTETVYGLGADATNQKAVSQIYEAKGRPSDNPLIVHIHDMSQMNDFVDKLEPKVQEFNGNILAGTYFIYITSKVRLSVSKSNWWFEFNCSENAKPPHWQRCITTY